MENHHLLTLHLIFLSVFSNTENSNRVEDILAKFRHDSKLSHEIDLKNRKRFPKFKCENQRILTAGGPGARKKNHYSIWTEKIN